MHAHACVHAQGPVWAEQNINLFPLALLLSNHKGYNLQTCSIDSSRKDLMKAAMHIYFLGTKPKIYVHLIR